MKKLGLFALAMALLVTLSQCKKEKTEVSNNESIKVPITLNVSGGNGSRVNVNTQNGKVTFENGDALYVASNGVYVGMLTYNGTNFSGEITEPTEGQKLHFYFLGNVDTEESLTEGTSTGCSVVISDQTENLPVISYNTSRENYEVGRTDYNATLLNKCALVKFNVTTPSNSPICITGMKNKVTVNFANNALTPSQDGEGVIMLPAGSGENVEKWAILLPQEALEEGEDGSAYSGIYSGSRPAIPIISENGYLTNGICFSVITGQVAPVGAINGLFSVSATRKVWFSQGNLQYIGSENRWRFANNQWEILGNNGQGSYYQDVDRDLFGWGTSGYNHGAICYKPWSISETDSDYYAYGSQTSNLYDQTGMADWGYNVIDGGGFYVYAWRTLTYNEWWYIFYTRSTNSGIRYAKARVNGVDGIILLPDNWIAGTYSLNNYNSSNALYSSNEISLSDWNDILETNGAVFLPSAGMRHGTHVSWVGSIYSGYYWSSSCVDGYVWCVLISDEAVSFGGGGRSNGYSVRLVQNYQP